MKTVNAPTMSLKPITISILLAMSLTGCGGGSDGNSHNSNTQQHEPTPPLKQKPLGEYALTKAGDDATFANYYQATLKSNNNQMVANGAMADSNSNDTSNKGTIAPTAAETGNTDNSFGVSSTNLIETGVDESDFVKQNADHIFVVNSQSNHINSYSKATKSIVGTYPLQDNKHFDGFYLHNNNLITVKQKTYADWIESDRLARKNGTLEVDIINASNPAQLVTDKSYQWEGDFRTSRRIGDNLFVVSSSSINDPWGCPIAYDKGMSVRAETTHTKTVNNANETSIKPVKAPIVAGDYPYPCEPKPLTPEQIAERMPIDIMGNKIKPAECLIPADYNKNSNGLNSNITLVTQVDLTGANKHQTTCIAASADNIYMHPDALYLAGTDYNDNLLTVRPMNNVAVDNGNDNNRASNTLNDKPAVAIDLEPYQQKTIINKFNLTNNKVSYAGSGAVAGEINWDTPSFSMNEYKGVLRVVTTDWQNGNIINQIHTLQEGKDKLALTTLATIPNKQQPKAIGKPNERVKGIRFVGDEGYVVTFQRTDPLYKIDLSDPKQPQVKGELQMTGYSTYLQRINDKLLLGVGFSADEEGRTTGLQTTVYDTSKNNPTIVSQDTISLSPEQARGLILPLDTDSRAIMTLKNANTMRVAIPYNISYYPQYNSQYENMRSQASSVEYNIDLKTGQLISYSPRALTPPLSNAQIGKQGLRGSFYNGETRALVDNNTLYYSLSNGTIKDYIWGVHKD